MKNDISEMVDSEPFANLATGRDRYSRRDFSKSLYQITKRLSRYPMPIAPIKETINEDGLEAG